MGGSSRSSGHSPWPWSSLCRSSALRQALARSGRVALERELLNQFHQYSITANIIHLDRLIAYNSNFQILGSTKSGINPAQNSGAGCPGLIEQARKRTGVLRAQILTTLCVNHHNVYYSVLTPIGGLKPIGYLEIVTDPVPVLAEIESKLDIPVRIRDRRDQNVYASDNWPAPENMGHALIAESLLATTSGETALKIAVMRDGNRLHDIGREVQAVAEAAGFSAEAARSSLGASGKARAYHDTEGFIEVVHDAETGQLLGGCIVGPEAGEQIHMMAAACQSSRGLWFFKDMNYSHPSWCEELETAIDPYTAAFAKSEKTLFRPGILAEYE